VCSPACKAAQRSRRLFSRRRCRVGSCVATVSRGLDEGSRRVRATGFLIGSTCSRRSSGPSPELEAYYAVLSRPVFASKS